MKIKYTPFKKGWSEKLLIYPEVSNPTSYINLPDGVYIVQSKEYWYVNRTWYFLRGVDPYSMQIEFERLPNLTEKEWIELRHCFNKLTSPWQHRVHIYCFRRYLKEQSRYERLFRLKVEKNKKNNK